MAKWILSEKYPLFERSYLRPIYRDYKFERVLTKFIRDEQITPKNYKEYSDYYSSLQEVVYDYYCANKEQSGDNIDKIFNYLTLQETDVKIITKQISRRRNWNVSKINSLSQEDFIKNGRAMFLIEMAFRIIERLILSQC